MSQTDRRVGLWLLVAVGLLTTAGSMIAGDLEPPGPPAPTMKTLQQVEPRTPIHAADLPLDITESGSYYLAENIITGGGGIEVSADDVTIDLRGFELSGGTLNGIRIIGTRRRVTIKDGTVSNWQNRGLDMFQGSDHQVINVRLISNGTDGLAMGDQGIVRDSVFRDNGSAGISQVTTTGITVTGSVFINQDNSGIRANDDSFIVGNTFYSNGFEGSDASIRVGSNCLVRDNYIDGSFHGIQALGSNNQILDNQITSVSNRGIFVSSTGNVVYRNSVRGAGFSAYDIAAGNDAGPIGTAASVTSPFANLAN